MKYLFLAAVLALQGCSGIIAAKNYTEITPEQLKALQDVGHEMVMCVTIGGPPVGGRTTYILRPKGMTGKIVLTPDCQIQTVEVDSRVNLKTP